MTNQTMKPSAEAGKRSALGKGFNSLLGIDEDLPAKPTQAHDHSINKINLGEIKPNPHQPRKIFESEDLESLTASIKEDGVVQPIIVSKLEGDDHYTLIAGERRWRASKKAGLTKIPAIVKQMSSETMLRVALIENIQRADLNIIEEANAYLSLINDFGLSHEECAKKVGKDRTTITNAIRLLSLPREIQDDLLTKKLSMGHGRAILSLDDKKLMLKARDVVVKKSLSVRQTESLCKKIQKSGVEPQAGTRTSDPDLDYFADELRAYLKTKVKISGTAKKGKLEISYFSLEELERVLDTIGLGSSS